MEEKGTQNVRYYHSHHSDSNFFHHFDENHKMHGVKRVIVFCFLIALLPATLIIIPLYLRTSVFADVIYQVAESDILEIRDGISSIFCQKHTLKMDTSFNAFQLSSKPEISTNHKHIRLKKSMILPDDTLEYWGFYLLKGASVKVKFCSRYKGSRILVVKGDRNLDTCGLLDHNKNKIGTNFAQGHEKVRITFEDKEEFVMKNKENINENTEINQLKAIKNETLDVDEEENENHGGESFDENDEVNYNSKNEIIKNTKTESRLQIGKTEILNITSIYQTDNNQNNSIENINGTNEQHRKRHRRHHKQRETIDINLKQIHKKFDYTFEKRKKEHERRKQEIYDELYKRKPRAKRSQVYDRKINHGGNAQDFIGEGSSNSISSFENGMLECYSGKILLTEEFPPSNQCTLNYLSKNSKHVSSIHEVTDDGYYYYIFYSDNDEIKNDIHAIFDIFKPTFQYANATQDDSHVCVNRTNCTFNIDSIFSNEYVVVEVPTRDGIEHEEDDVTLLVSVCHPRMSVYIIFPISVLVLILSCSFL